MTTPSSVDWKDEILEMVYSETRQQIQDYEKHKPPKLKKEFMIRAKAQLQAHINQAMVEARIDELKEFKKNTPLVDALQIKRMLQWRIDKLKTQKDTIDEDT